MSGFRSINKNKALLKSKKSKFLDPTKGYLSKWGIIILTKSEVLVTVYLYALNFLLSIFIFPQLKKLFKSDKTIKEWSFWVTL